MVDFHFKGNKMVGARQIEWLPHRDKKIDVRYIVIHYTGGSKLDNTIDYLRKEKLSYQLLIDRDGTVTQATPLNKRASHSGYSNWKGYDNLNDYSIGISLNNLGYLDRQGTKYYRTNSHGDPITPIFDQSEVVKGKHWNGHNGSTIMGWELYTEAQYFSLVKLCKALMSSFPSIMGITSHDQVAIGRKPDPGIAFEWAKLYEAIPFMLKDLGPLYQVHNVRKADNLMVRNGPSASWGVHDKLSSGTKVHLRSHAYKYHKGVPKKSEWVSVALEGSYEHHGFVHSGYLKPST